MGNRLHRLIEWPLWSWSHLSISVAALLVVLALVGQATSFFEPRTVAGPAKVAPSASRLPSPATNEETSAPTPTTARAKTPAAIPAPGSSLVRRATNGSCEAAASAFMTSWVKTGLPSARWLDGLRPHAVPKLIEQLSRTDPSSVPASRVSTAPVEKLTQPGAESFRFATDGGRVDVTTQKSSASCLVSALEPANDVPGAPKPTLTPAPAAS